MWIASQLDPIDSSTDSPSGGSTRRFASKIQFDANRPAMHDSNHTSEQKLAALHKRDVRFSSFWALSQISTPPNFEWSSNDDIREEIFANGVSEGATYKYYYHSSQGEGQYIYLIEDGIWANHPVSQTNFLIFGASLIQVRNFLDYNMNNCKGKATGILLGH